MRAAPLLIAAIIAVLPASTFAKSSGKARSAVSGKYVSKGYATKNPRTTVVERKNRK